MFEDLVKKARVHGMAVSIFNGREAVYSHTTGLPNWRWFEEDRKLRFHFEPGTRYSYSGEGLTFLQVVLERLTKKPLEDLMREKVFIPTG